jgi:hypothetical protein
MPRYEPKVPKSYSESKLAKALAYVGGEPEDAILDMGTPMPLISKLKMLKLFPRNYQKDLVGSFRKIPQKVFDEIDKVNFRSRQEMYARGEAEFIPRGELRGRLEELIPNTSEINFTDYFRGGKPPRKTHTQTVLHEVGHAAQFAHQPYFKPIYDERPLVHELATDYWVERLRPDLKGYYQNNLALSGEELHNPAKALAQALAEALGMK